jgi:hypothetical protein
MSEPKITHAAIQSVMDAIANAHPEVGVVALNARDARNLLDAVLANNVPHVPEAGNAVLRNWMMAAFHAMVLADRVLNELSGLDEDFEGGDELKSRARESENMIAAACAQLPGLLGFVAASSIPNPAVPTCVAHLSLKERSGARSVAEIEKLFVASVASTPVLAGLADMTRQESGRYTATSTQILSFGFGLGVRCADRLRAPTPVALSVEIDGG